MFDRLDTKARRVLELAQEEALQFAHQYLGTEHLLIALARTDGTSGLLAGLGCRPDTARALVVAVIGHGLPAHHAPETLLAAVGIDLGEVRRRIETTFGSEAMTRASQRVQRRRRWRQRLPWPGCELSPARSALLGERCRGMAPRVKRVVEMAAREAAPGLATPAHLLWAIAEEGEGVDLRDREMSRTTRGRLPLILSGRCAVTVPMSAPPRCPNRALSPDRSVVT